MSPLINVTALINVPKDSKKEGILDLKALRSTSQDMFVGVFFRDNSF